MTAFNPVNDATCLIYFPNWTDYPGSFWQDTSGGTPADANGELVKVVNSGLTSIDWGALSNLDTRRAAIGTDGGTQFGLIGGNEACLRYNNTSFANAIHIDGYADIAGMFKLPANSGSEYIVGNDNFSTTARGFGVYVLADGTLAGYINNGSGRAIFLQTTETVDDDEWHRFHFHTEPGSGACTLQVDNGRVIYGTLGTLSAAGNNAASFITIGNRATVGSVRFNGQLKNVRVGTAWDTADKDAWFDDPQNAAGDLVGDPELRTDNLHLNLRRDRGYNRVALWFNGIDMYGTGTDGPVFDDSGADDSPDGTSWRGGPHGRETVNSVTVNGSPVVDGTIYTGSKTVVVNSTLADSFDAVKTTRLSGSQMTTTVRMTRLGDAFSINPSYPFRFSRVLAFDNYLSLDVDGQELDSGTTTLNDNSIVVIDDAARAVAQFSSTLGVMVLCVLTKGYGSTSEFIIADSSVDKRLYLRLKGAWLNPSEGTVLEFSAITKFYETDSGSWEALAASELASILSLSSGKRNMGLNLGLGF